MIDVNVWDNQNTQYNQYCKIGGDASSYADATCQFTAKAGITQYNISGGHWALLNETYEDCSYGECQNEWFDPYDLQFDNSLDILDPFEAYFPASSFEEVGYLSPDVMLGGTTDYAAVTIPAKCGGNGVEDAMIAEYTAIFQLPNGKSWRSTFKPVCKDFSWILAWIQTGAYTWGELTVDQSTGYGQFAVLQPYLESGLGSVTNSVGYHLPISSGYRNPAAEVTVTVKNCLYPNQASCTPAAASRHMAGDGVDVKTYGSQTKWNSLQTAGHHASGCVEPQIQSSLNHSHIDWRDLYYVNEVQSGISTTFTWPRGSCPAKW